MLPKQVERETHSLTFPRCKELLICWFAACKLTSALFFHGQKKFFTGNNIHRFLLSATRDDSTWIKFQDWGCVVTWNRFSIKNFSDRFHFAAVVETIIAWKQICARVNHGKVTKAEPSLLIPRKLVANLLLLIVGTIKWFLTVAKGFSKHSHCIYLRALNVVISPDFGVKSDVRRSNIWRLWKYRRKRTKSPRFRFYAISGWLFPWSLLFPNWGCCKHLWLQCLNLVWFLPCGTLILVRVYALFPLKKDLQFWVGNRDAVLTKKVWERIQKIAILKQLPTQQRSSHGFPPHYTPG